jgi:hypothetical protein
MWLVWSYKVCHNIVEWRSLAHSKLGIHMDLTLEPWKPHKNPSEEGKLRKKNSLVTYLHIHICRQFTSCLNILNLLLKYIAFSRPKKNLYTTFLFPATKEHILCLQFYILRLVVQSITNSIFYSTVHDLITH